MTFRLIKEAQIKSTLSADDIRMLEVVKSALGKDSIAAVVESYVPSPVDYSKWLDVIQGYARDSGIKLRKKDDFFDIAGAVLENDPKQPPYSMQDAILEKLWLDFKSQRHMKKIADVAQAAEDEERVASAARTMVDPISDEFGDDLGDDLGDDMTADGSMNFDDQLDGTTDDEAFRDSAERDMEPASDLADGEEAWWHDDEDDSDPVAFPKFASRNQEDRPNDLAGVPEEDNFDPKADEYNDAFGTRPPPSFENEEKTVAPKKMSVLQQMLTLPKTSINSLVKDVESEGAAAWRQHSLPQNPHPKGSMAYKAWERGMTRAMRDQVGGGRESPKPSTKKKTKR